MSEWHFSGVSAGCRIAEAVPPNASIMIRPTSAGTATVYLSTKDRDVCRQDGFRNEFTAGWEEWPAGPVTALTSDVTAGSVNAVAIKVTSGVWELDIVAL